MGLWCWGSHGLDWIGLISSSGLLLLLGFVIIRRERASERVILFAKDVGLRLDCASMCLFFSFLFFSLYSTHLFRADGSGKGHAARPLPTRNAVAEGIVDGLSKHAVFDAAA